jgi:hypothetical protein
LQPSNPALDLWPRSRAHYLPSYRLLAPAHVLSQDLWCGQIPRSWCGLLSLLRLCQETRITGSSSTFKLQSPASKGPAPSICALPTAYSHLGQNWSLALMHWWDAFKLSFVSLAE